MSTDHPMNLPIGRFLGKGMFNHCDRVRALCEEKLGGPEGVAELFPESDYQLTHNALFPHDCIHVENLGGQINAPELQNQRLTIGISPWLFKGGEAAFCRAVAFVEGVARACTGLLHPRRPTCRNVARIRCHGEGALPIFCAEWLLAVFSR